MLATLIASILMLGATSHAQTTTPNVKTEILGTGDEALLGYGATAANPTGPLTDPEGDGLDALGAATDPSWNWVEITGNDEADFEGGENALADGTVMPLAAMRTVRALTRRHGIAVHLDGARLFNAALALGVPAAALAAEADSVTFCLSKGLGAPIGSVLCGSADFIDRALHLRKRMGGGMRQVGVLAAAGLVALDSGVARLQEDHDNAKLLATLLAEIPGVVLDVASVQTNMVFCSLDEARGRSMAGLVAFLGARQILTYEPGWWGLRFVTSSRVDEGDVRALAAAVRDYLEGRS